MPKEVTYKEFYFPPINDNEDFDVVKEYYKAQNNLGIYDGKMFCPECATAELKFTPEAKSHRAFLSAIAADQHLPNCSYKYGISSTKSTKAYFERLSDIQVQDKMASILRMINRQANIGGGAGGRYAPNHGNNPLILDIDDEQSSRVRRSLPRRDLNKALKKEYADLLCAFYARDAYMRVEITERVNKKGEKYELHYLHIKTTSGKRYRIYRGTHKDEVIPDRQYNVVLIGSFSEKTLPYSIKHIHLIERDTQYGSKPNQYAIKIE